MSAGEKKNQLNANLCFCLILTQTFEITDYSLWNEMLTFGIVETMLKYCSGQFVLQIIN